MEEQKLHCLNRMLGRREGTSVALRKIEDQTRQHYAEIVALAQEEFIGMMLLDGCFILEFIRIRISEASQPENDPVFSVDWTRYCIRRDLLLLENQLPFIVLTTLYDLMKEGFNNRSLIDLVLKVFRHDASPSLPQGIDCYQHLLDIVYQGMVFKALEGTVIENSQKYFLLPSALNLEESGIKFRLGESDWLLDIKFDKGTLEIPSIMIEDDTESFFQNLVAYEQQCQGGKTKYVTEYVRFLDCLINTTKDAELLRQKKIINHILGDDEMITKMFNKIGDSAVVYSCYYASIIDKVKEHCNKRRNRWMAMLKRDYFKSPSALISVLAAIKLLFLTLMQTVYTVMSYHKKD